MADSQDRSLKKLRLWVTIISVVLLCVSLFLLSHPGFQLWANQPAIDILFSFAFGTLVAIGVLWLGPPLAHKFNNICKTVEKQQELETVVDVHRSESEDTPAKPPEIGEFRDRHVLVIGDQLVGKTQLIRTLCGDFRPVDVSDRTGQADDEAEHRIVFGPVFGSNRLVFIDHRGQHFGTISEALAAESLLGTDIHALVFMTDLFDLPQRQNKQTKDEWEKVVTDFMYAKRDAPDPERIAKHNQQLADGSLDQLISNNQLGPLAENGAGLRSMFLFINKIDKLKDWNRDLTDDSYIKPFKDILTSLERRATNMQKATGKQVATGWSAGSAMQGWGIAGKGRLLDALISEPTEQNADEQ